MSIDLTDADIERLIREKKVLPQDFDKFLAPKPKRGRKESQLAVKGEAGSEFLLIFSQANANPLCFSLILAYQLPHSNRLFRLRRYNGKHGEHSNGLERQTFYDFHIHKATERYQDEGFSEDAYAEPTNRFEDFRSAVDCLIEDCNLEVPLGWQHNLF